MQPAKVQFMFDFGSPNAYLAELVIPDVERRTGVKFEYVPVLLGGIYKLTGNRSPAGLSAGYKEQARVPGTRDPAFHPPAQHHEIPQKPVLSSEYAAIDARCGRGAV